MIPVLLPGAPPESKLPPLLKTLTVVDLRYGLNEDGLNRLSWGITGQKPEQSLKSEKSREDYIRDLTAELKTEPAYTIYISYAPPIDGQPNVISEQLLNKIMFRITRECINYASLYIQQAALLRY